ncbi:hypothetical protein HPB50_024883 [Hyalomma asiaticum]|uniref:Uncharacterized protein n=1 Tax=Hyalomma asiaticum TaxID=266040 RepID=A0ACB7SCU8_HYAAI|nr:hypothetical protein HPB50_024883 [Hyalomma asiaticum]
MSLAEARFRSDSWPLRLSGCLPPPHHEDRTPVGQCRWGYAALTATLVITASLLELTSLLGRSLLGNRRLGIFNGGLFFTIRLLLLAKVSTQLATLLVKSRDTRALVARAAQYERTCRQPPAHHVPLRCKTIGRALHLFVVTAFFTARWYVFLTWMVLPTFLSAALSIVTAMAAAAVTAWDSAPGILAKCFAEVFVQYLRTENLALAAAARGKVLVVGAKERNSDDLRAVLDDCRANVEAVLRMVETAQGLLGTLLLLSFGANMGVLCAVLYSLTDSSTPTGLLMSGMLYSSLRFADALDVAFASESLANEVDELKWTLRSLPFRGRRDDLARDVRSFHKILDPSAMFLRAHGFFRVNVAQMISVAERPGGSNADGEVYEDDEEVSREPLQLTVMSIMNKETRVEAFPNDSVLDLKLLLQDILLVPVDQQLLVYRYQALTDSDTLAECGLRDGAQLTLILRMRGGDPTPVVLDVSGFLESKKSVSDVASSAEAAADVIPKNHSEEEPLQLSIRIKRGKCVVVESRLGATVGSVKQSVQKLTGVPAAHQTLTFRGQDMSDEHTLAHYELRDRCAVFFGTALPAAAATNDRQAAATLLADVATRLWNLFF